VFWQTPTRGGTPRRIDLRDARSPQYAKFLRQFIPKLWDFLNRQGCQDRWLQHISDEPGLGDLDAYRQLAATVRSAAPGIKLLDALSDPQLADQNDYPVPVEHCYERVVAESHVPRENVWLYYCCGPTGRWPNRFIEYPLIRLRIVTWLCFQNRIPGFLHWGYNYWSAIRKKTHNPWDDPSTHRHPAGDGLMVYPPRDDRMTGQDVIDSIRWEIVREAMEDHEYLVMARALADAGNKSARKLLAAIARDITPGWQNHTRDWKRLYAARARLGALLEKAGA
jgi:hypothetical protein